jgi:hypothetical protein
MSNEKQAREDAAKCEECLPRDQAERLFTHGMHEDSLFNSRMHSFLVIQTVMLAAIGLHQKAAAIWIVRAIAIAALILSLVWTYVQTRQKHKLDVLVHRLEKFLPEFGRTRRWASSPPYVPSATWLLTYIIPGSFVVLWIVIVVSAFLR